MVIGSILSWGLQLEDAPPPAGGGDVGEILLATAISFAAVAAVAVVGVLHRRRGMLDPLVRQVEERTGLPAWTVLPVGIVGASLLVAVWGYYWDVSWHIDRGRDPGAFANPAHWFIILGLDGIAFGGLLALILGDGRSPSAVRLTRSWSVPVGAVLLVGVRRRRAGRLPARRHLAPPVRPGRHRLGPDPHPADRRGVAVDAGLLGAGGRGRARGGRRAHRGGPPHRPGRRRRASPARCSSGCRRCRSSSTSACRSSGACTTRCSSPSAPAWPSSPRASGSGGAGP